VTITSGGSVGVGDDTPASLFTVGAGDAFQVNSSGVVLAGSWNGADVDISDYTNLSVSNGITLTGDVLSVTAAGGLAQTTGGLTTTGVLEDLNTLGAPSADGEFIVATGAGTFAYESGATVRTSLGLVAGGAGDIWVEKAGDTMTGNLVMGGSAANIALGSNYLSGDGDDEGIYVTSTGNVGIGTTTPAQKLTVIGSIDASVQFLGQDADTISTPSYSWSGDTNTGMYRPGADIIGFTTGGAERARVVSTGLSIAALAGNGIGFWGGAPTTYGVMMSNSATYRYGEVTDYYIANIVSSGTSRGFVWSYGSVPSMALNANSGNLAMKGTLTVNGTATSTIAGSLALGVSTSSAAAKLHVLSTTEQLRLAYDSSSYWTDTVDSFGNRTMAGIGSGGSLNIDLYGGSTGDFSINSDDFYVDTSTANVGIGISSPQSPLHVYAEVTPGVTVQRNTGADAAMVFKNADDTTGYFMGISAAEKFSIGKSSTLSSSNFLTIQSDGNVGLGTTAPIGRFNSVGVSSSSQNIVLSHTHGGDADGVDGGLAISGTKMQSIDFEYSGYSGSPDPIFASIATKNYNTTGSGWTTGNTDRYKAGLSFYTMHGMSGGLLERMTITSTGNVGIGDTAPNQLLGLLGTNAQTSIEESDTEFLRMGVGETVETSVIGWDDADALHLGLYSGPTDTTLDSKMVITSAGNVGIGTTTPADELVIVGSSPTINLSNTGGTGGDGGILRFGDTQSGATTDQARIYASKTCGGACNAADLFFQTVSSNTLGDRMVIKAAGNVGIGTTTPSHLFTVAGDTNITGALRFGGNAGTAGQVLLSNGSSAPTWTATSSLGLGATFFQQNGNSFGTTATLGTNDSQNLAFETNGATRMTIASTTGNVGIGTTAPLSALDINTGALTLRESVTTYSQLITDGTGLHFKVNAGLANVGRNFVFESSTSGGALTERMRIDSSGNVGIGTSSPENIDGWARVLDVYGAVNSKSIVTTSAIRGGMYAHNLGYFSAPAGMIMGANSNHPVSFITNGATRMTINTSGNVGIGTASPSASSKLHIDGSNALIYTEPSADDGQWNGLSTLNSSGIVIGGFTANTQSGEVAVGSRNASYFTTIYGGSAERMRITSAGNVGIGTTTPGSRLEVMSSGVAAFPATSGTTQSTGGRLRLSTSGAGGVLDMGTAGGFGGWIQMTNYTDLSLNYPLLLNPNGGNVGIGTTTPSHLFTVAGDTNQTGALRFGGNAGTTGQVLLSNGSSAPTWTATSSLGLAAGFFAQDGNSFGTTATLGTNDSQNLAFETNNSARMTITSGGNVGIGTTTPTSRLAIQTTGTTDILNLFETGGTEVFTVLESGNVGIGTTAPGAKLHVVAETRYNFGNEYAIVAADTSNPNQRVSLGYDDALSAGVLQAATEGSSWDTLLLNPNGGNVGIGTTTPSHLFTVAGDTNITGALRFGGNAGTTGQILLSNGSSAPTWTATSSLGLAAGFFAQDGNSFGTTATLGTNDSQNLAFETNNTTRMTIASTTGNVGIGTTGPEMPLAVYRAASATLGAGSIGLDYGSGSLWTFRLDSSDFDFNLDRKSGGTWYNALSIDRASGHVGIGTTAPQDELHITEGTGHISFGTASGANAGIAFLNAAVTTANYSLLGNGTDTFLGRPTGGVIQFRENNTTQMTIASGGNVGIGTTTPTSKLDVYGGQLSIYGAGAGIAINRPGAPGFVAIQQDGTGGGRVSSVSTGGLSFQTSNGGTTWAAFDSSGNLGIGTTSPSTRLHVYGTSGTIRSDSTATVNVATDVLVANNIGDSFRSYGAKLQVQRDGSLGQGWNFVVTDTLGTVAEAMRVTPAGNVGIGTTNPTTKLFIKSATGVNSILGIDTTDSGNSTSNATIRLYEAGTNKWDIYNDGDAGDLFKIEPTGGTNSLTINSTGNVGIGVTSPAYHLSVDAGANGSSAGAVFHSDTYGTVIESESTSASYYVLNVKSGASSTLGSGGNSLLYVRNDGAVGIGTTTLGARLSLQTTGTTDILNLFETGGTEVFTVLENGNVGIGTTSPTLTAVSGLHIKGATAAGLRLEGGTGAGGYELATVGGAHNFGLYDVTNAAYRLYVLDNGNVGIGTVSPDTNLEVVASDTSNGIFIERAGTDRIKLTGDGVMIWGAAADYGLLSWDTGRAIVASASGKNLSLGGGTTAAHVTIASTTGNVGIGTTAPGAKLHVVAETRYNFGNEYAIVAADTSNPNQRVSLGYDDALSAGVLQAATEGSSWDTLLLNPNGGNVGIGTTSPAFKLDVNGTARFGDSTNGVDFGSAAMRFTGSAPSIYTNGYGAPLKINASAIYLNGASGGNVGIGTSTPTASLSVAGDMRLTGGFYDAANSAGTSGMILSSTGSGTAWVATSTLSSALNAFVQAGNSFGSTAVLGTNDANNLAFETNNSTRMTISSSGNVGIGTTTPIAVVDVWQKNTSEAGLNVQGFANNAVPVFQVTGGASPNTRLMAVTGTQGEVLTVANTAVGIGTTTPAAKLQVLSTTEQLRLSYNTSSYWTDTIASDGGRTLTGFGTDGDLNIVFTGATDGDFSINSDDLFVDTSAGGLVGLGTASPTAKLTVNEASNATKTTFTQAVTSAGILINTDYVASSYTPGIFWNTSNNSPTKPKAGIFLQETASGSYMYLGTSNAYATGITNDGIIINPTGGVTFTNASTTNLTVSGSSYLTGATTLGSTLTVTGQSTFNDDVNMGTGDQVKFAGEVGDKINLYSTSYGIGIESNTLTQWSGVNHRWRIGGTSVSSGTQYMLLNTTGLTVTGSIDASVQFLGQAADTVSAPSFSWTGDTNVGMYRPTTDTIGFTTAGAERMRVTSTGLVGIGATPTSMFQVGPTTVASTWTDTSNAQVFIGGADNEAAVKAFQINDENQNEYFHISSTGIGNADLGRAYFAGVVGIGTTTPGSVLTVAGTTYLGGDLTVNGTVKLASLSTGFVKSSSDGTLSVDTNTYATSEKGVYYIEGNTTGTAGTWTGSHADISSYYPGLMVAYKIGIAGAATTQLDINSLGAVTVRRTTANLTTHLPVGTIVLLTYDGTYWVWADYSDGQESYTVRWNTSVKNNSSDINHGYKLTLETPDGTFAPVSVGSSITANSNTISSQTFKLGGQVLYYNSGTDVAVDGTYSTVYEGITSAEMEYWNNRGTGAWATAGLPVYLVATPSDDGDTFTLVGSGTTGTLTTQTLPTTEDGLIYIQIGFMNTTSDNWRLSTVHPIFEFKNGVLRNYMPKINKMDSLYVMNNLGIGTTTPSAKLQITGTAGSGDIFAIASSTNTRLFTVTAAGNVGIGDATPSALLTVGNGDLFQINATGQLTIAGAQVTYSAATKNIIANNTADAWTIATSSTATPLISITTTTGSEMVVIGKKGGDVYVGDVGSASNLVFEESSTIHGQGGNTLTFGQTGDKINFAVNIGIGSSTPSYPITHSSGAFLSVGGTWTNASDRNIKENLTELDGEEILEKIKNLDITEWNYIAEGSSTRHIGPMAQDFFAAFKLGDNDRSITTVDASGVALAGIKELAKKIDLLTLSQNSSSTILANSNQSGTSGILHIIKDWLADFGISFTRTLARFGNVAASALTIGSEEQPNGITLFDRRTGEAYCVLIEDGEMVHETGACKPHDEPEIELMGEQIIELEVGESYTDEGATAEDWEGESLPIEVFVNDAATSSVSIDTSVMGEYHIVYVATDSDGLSASTTRSVLVGVSVENSTILDEVNDENGNESTDGDSQDVTSGEGEGEEETIVDSGEGEIPEAPVEEIGGEEPTEPDTEPTTSGDESDSTAGAGDDGSEDQGNPSSGADADAVPGTDAGTGDGLVE
jgi:hypothetical protein